MKHISQSSYEQNCSFFIVYYGSHEPTLEFLIQHLCAETPDSVLKNFLQTLRITTFSMKVLKLYQQIISHVHDAWTQEGRRGWLQQLKPWETDAIRMCARAKILIFGH